MTRDDEGATMAQPTEVTFLGGLSLRSGSGTLATFRDCRCWIIHLAQGIAVFPCVAHEQSVRGVVEGST